MCWAYSRLTICARILPLYILIIIVLLLECRLGQVDCSRDVFELVTIDIAQARVGVIAPE